MLITISSTSSEIVPSCKLHPFSLITCLIDTRHTPLVIRTPNPSSSETDDSGLNFDGSLCENLPTRRIHNSLYSLMRYFFRQPKYVVVESSSYFAIWISFCYELVNWHSIS